MKLRVLALIVACPTWIFGQALTTVTDTVSTPTGGHPSGTVTLSWNRFLNATHTVIPAGNVVVQVAAGVFTVNLTPTDTAVPVGTCYNAAWALQGSPPYRRTWNVPTVGTPVGLNTVESDTQCNPQTAAAIAPAQITNGGATTGQALVWNGFYWAPGTATGAPTNPGGTNGQVQFNSLGHFAGFTMAGDCVLALPNIVCTKTNGTIFSASATIDTTNAANISSGTLAPLRGGTGTGALTQGSIPFIGISGVYQQDNANLYWNSATQMLGLGTNSPSFAISVVRSSGGAFLNMDAHDGASQSGFNFVIAGSLKYQIGSQANGGMFMYDATRGRDFLEVITSSGNISLQPTVGNVGVGSVSPAVKLQIVNPSDGVSAPALGTAAGGVAMLGATGLYGLYIGEYGSTGDSWIQSMRNDSATAYNLNLQPSGGNVGISTTTPLTNLHVITGGVTSGFGATPAGRGMAVSGLSGSDKIYMEATDAMSGQRVFAFDNSFGALSLSSFSDSAGGFVTQNIIKFKYDGSIILPISGTQCLHTVNGVISGTGSDCGAGGGGGTVTHTLGALTNNQLIFGNGSADIKVGNLTGNVTTAGGTATTIANGVITNAMLVAPYQQAAVGITGTVSITAVTHGKGAYAIPTCFDNSSPAVYVQCAYSRAANGDLVFNFAPGTFNGTIEVH